MAKFVEDTLFQRIKSVSWARETHVAFRVVLRFAKFGTSYTTNCGSGNGDPATQEFPPSWQFSVPYVDYQYDYGTVGFWDGHEWDFAPQGGFAIDVPSFSERVTFVDRELPHGTQGQLPGTSVFRNAARLGPNYTGGGIGIPVPQFESSDFTPSGPLHAEVLAWTGQSNVRCFGPSGGGGSIYYDVTGGLVPGGTSNDLVESLTVSFFGKPCTVIGMHSVPFSLDRIRDGANALNTANMPNVVVVLAEIGN